MCGTKTQIKLCNILDQRIHLTSLGNIHIHRQDIAMLFISTSNATFSSMANTLPRTLLTQVELSNT